MDSNPSAPAQPCEHSPTDTEVSSPSFHPSQFHLTITAAQQWSPAPAQNDETIVKIEDDGLTERNDNDVDFSCPQLPDSLAEIHEQVYHYVRAEWAKNKTVTPISSKAWFKTEWRQYSSVLIVHVGFQFEFGEEQVKLEDNMDAPSDNAALRFDRLNEAERRVLLYAHRLYDGKRSLMPKRGLISKIEEMGPEEDVFNMNLKYELQMEGVGKGKRASGDLNGGVTGKRRRYGSS